jgi:hypothetical protein
MSTDLGDSDKTSDIPASSADGPVIVSRAMTTIRDLANNIDENWRSTQSEFVRGACDDAEMAAEFVNRMPVSNAAFTLALWENDAYVRSFEKMRLAVRSISGCLLDIDRSNGKPRPRSVRTLTEDAAKLRRGLYDAIIAVRNVVRQSEATVPLRDREMALQLADKIEDQIVARGLGGVDVAENEAKRVLTRIWGVYAEARRAAGDIGAKSLGHEYAKYAAREARVANILRWIVGGLTLVVVAGAVWFNYRVTEATVVLELARLSATIPLGLLAVYLAKESTKHRDAARWSRELAIALHTVDVYAEGSPAPDGQALRQALGMRVYGATPDRTTSAPDPVLIKDALDLLKKVAETAQGPADLVQRLRDILEKLRDGK